MKHIIICAGDRLGKNSLIEGLVKHYNYDNIIIRHFSKPPKEFKEETSLEFQAKCFRKEGQLLEIINQLEEDEYNYYENIVIWNRSPFGEYVYSQLFRNQDKDEIENYLRNFEENFLLSNEETYFILLTADPEFFLSQEDGNSLSQNLSQKTQELKLFDEIFDKISISKKIKIKVDLNNKFLPKQDILNEVINFIKSNN